MTTRVATEEDRAWYARAVPTADLRGAWTAALFRLAHDRAVPGGAPGADGLSPGRYDPRRLGPLRQAVLDGGWRPQRLLKRTVRGGTRAREVGIPTLDDQVVLAALHLLLDPPLDGQLRAHVWGFRQGRSRQEAVGTLCGRAGGTALVRADVRRMFESLDHAFLRSAMAACWPDPFARQVVDRVLAAWQPGVGVPTGASVSPSLSNAYLHVGVDAWIAGSGILAAPAASPVRWADAAAQLLGLGWTGAGRFVSAVRYADDFALLVRGDGREALAGLGRALAASGLTLHPDKSRIHILDRPDHWPARVLGIDLAPRRTPAGKVLAPVVS